MARVVYSRGAVTDLARLFAFLEQDPSGAESALEAIRSAVSMLAHHPFVGRVVSDDLRELVISYGKSGYVALYRYVPVRQRVDVLAIKHQRELDYST